RLNELTNNGTSNGTTALIRSFNGPVRKSTPRDAWALEILSVSCKSVGIKRNEIDIINASSCTGNFTFFNGCNISSIASVISIGVVVNVNNDVTRRSRQKRIEIANPWMSQPEQTLNVNNSKTTVPSFVTIKCRINVKMIKNHTGVNPFKINRRGIFVVNILAKANKVKIV